MCLLYSLTAKGDVPKCLVLFDLSVQRYPADNLLLYDQRKALTRHISEAGIVFALKMTFNRKADDQFNKPLFIL